jgi:hypothetical protein
MITLVSKAYSEHYCYQHASADVVVQCMVVDDAATLIVHPSFEIDWTPRTTFLAEKEPELAEMLEHMGILQGRSRESFAEELRYIETYQLNFDMLPQNGTFYGLQSGTFSMVFIPDTNLAFIIITEYRTRGNIGYCGILTDTCPKVKFPRSEPYDFDVCTPGVEYYGVEEVLLTRGHTPVCDVGGNSGPSSCASTGVPLANETALSSSQMSLAMSDTSACDEEPSKWWVYLLIAIAGLLLIGVGVGGYMIAFGEKEEAQATLPSTTSEATVASNSNGNGNGDDGNGDALQGTSIQLKKLD